MLTKEPTEAPAGIPADYAGHVFGGVEAGGTKFVCALGDGMGTIHDFVRFPTTSPAETLGRTVHFFQQRAPIEALGMGSFGPIDLDLRSPTYGSITTTPKPGWAGTNLVHALREHFDVPIAFDLDVNAAAMGECLFGAGQDVESLLYLTIGTGIGGGFVSEGQLLHGLVHPEMGHLHVRRLPGDRFAGTCPYHGDCLEGLVAGPALAARTGGDAALLPDSHPVWDLVAAYVGEALAIFVLLLSPQRIVLGGGVMERLHLFPGIRRRLRETLAGYVKHAALEDKVDHYVVPPALGSRPGVLGALALARRLRTH